jgi:hypothetical protein
MISPSRRTIATAAALGALLTAATPASASAHRRVRHRHHHSTVIPQHNGGDRDADNNGARSDGDGNV